MPERAAADVGLGDAGHRNRRHHPRVDTLLFERILKRKRIHHRREHAHIVGGRAVEAFRRRCHSAENIASAYDQAKLVALGFCGGDLARETRGGFRIDAKLALAHKRLTRKLQEDPVEAGAWHARG